jgi:hypothetical protein
MTIRCGALVERIVWQRKVALYERERRSRPAYRPIGLSGVRFRGALAAMKRRRKARAR